MTSKHVLQDIVRMQKNGVPVGMFSVCSAHPLVIEASARRASDTNRPLLIEATSNQVNQYGGYTGMTPQDFRQFVLSMARSVGLSPSSLILGGDHLGPNPWKTLGQVEAMEEACRMVREYVRAGFSKIHLDASMPLTGDHLGPGEPLAPEVAAERTATLCAAAEQACGAKGSPYLPVYVIGTEVPIPGGGQGLEFGVEVTQTDDFHETVKLTREAFFRHELQDAWDRVIAVVVQPGVEFDSRKIHEYDRAKARDLVKALSGYPNLVFEGHSTDYQRPDLLCQLVEDGVAILKVGPALTFAMREALFLLNHIEEELSFVFDKKSNLIEVLDRAMAMNPANWKNHYIGTEDDLKLARKYGLSDRSRYYWNIPEVSQAVKQLFANLNQETIPLSLVSQFFPRQYSKIRLGTLENGPRALVLGRIMDVLEDYSSAVSPQGL